MVFVNLVLCGKCQINRVKTEGVVQFIDILGPFFAMLKGHNSTMTKLTRSKMASCTPTISHYHLWQVSSDLDRN